jgi:signal transduction histidine kinase/ActR/RegA family two-component response regulator
MKKTDPAGAPETAETPQGTPPSREEARRPRKAPEDDGARDASETVLDAVRAKEQEAQYLEQLQKINNRLINTQRDLIRANHRADAAGRAKDEFMARTSHDMRTPINAVIGFNELIRQKITQDPPAADGGREILSYLDYSDQSAKFLLSLISDILDLSKIGQNTIELARKPFLLGDCLDAVDAMIRPQMEKKGINYTLESGLDPACWYWGDAVRVQQIFMNLLNNALKFTPAEGHIAFRAVPRGCEGGRETFCFEVADSGIGMSPEFQKRMFQPFEQENQNSGGGAGLGLAITKRLVDLMEGEIAVESQPAAGTTFRVSLGFEEAGSRTEAQAQPRSAADYDFAGRRVLVCDDNFSNRLILSKLLANRHCTVEEAADGREAVELFKGSPEGALDLIVMDVRMPVMDGLAAARAIRALPREDAARVPIIALSANAYQSDVRLSREAGMDRHLAKPIDTLAFFKVMEELMGEKKS